MSRASDDLATLDALLADTKVVAAGGATYKGKFVSFTELTSIRAGVNRTVSAEKKKTSAGETSVAEARKSVSNALRELNDYLERTKSLSRTPAKEAVDTFQGRITRALSALRKLSPNDPLLVSAGLAQAAPPATTGRGLREGGQEDVIPAEVKFRAPKKGVTTTVVTPKTGPTGGGATGVVVDPVARKTFVDAELAKRGLTDTAANRATLRKEYDAKSQPVSAELTPAIEEAFRTKYPQYAWMLTDLDRNKYSDMFQLIAEASNPLREMSAEEFKRRFEGTSFTQELSLKRINRELISSIGSFSWGSGQLGKFLNKANQFGYTGDSLKQAAYQELLVKDPATGAYKNPNAVNEVRASSPYLRLKKIGTAYLSPLSDDRIIESLTGGISEDDVLRISREKAIALYPHLTRQIEAGLTLSDLAYDYQRTAADLLELTPEQIDMSKGKFNLALKTGEGGKERMMSTSEWIQTIKSDADFGWQYTKQANDQATNAALNIAKAFGKVR
jgi:hypothetical protein